MLSLVLQGAHPGDTLVFNPRGPSLGLEKGPLNLAPS